MGPLASAHLATAGRDASRQTLFCCTGASWEPDHAADALTCSSGELILVNTAIVHCNILFQQEYQGAVYVRFWG